MRTDHSSIFEESVKYETQIQLYYEARHLPDPENLVHTYLKQETVPNVSAQYPKYSYIFVDIKLATIVGIYFHLFK